MRLCCVQTAAMQQVLDQDVQIDEDVTDFWKLPTQGINTFDRWSKQLNEWS